MARTKASVGAKVSSGKSSKARCSVAPPSSSSSSSGSSIRSNHISSGSGNPVCHQPTPKWQRPITNFFISKEPDAEADSDSEAGTSKPRKRNVIESDDEEHTESPEPEKEGSDRPKNSVLDDSIELAPLTGENSHKIEEYYKKNSDDQSRNEEIPSENEQINLKIKENHSKNEIKNGVNPPKGKGTGKKTKENNNNNINNNRKSLKRDLEVTEEISPINKKVKVH